MNNKRRGRGTTARITTHSRFCFNKRRCFFFFFLRVWFLFTIYLRAFIKSQFARKPMHLGVLHLILDSFSLFG